MSEVRQNILDEMQLSGRQHINGSNDFHKNLAVIQWQFGNYPSITFKHYKCVLYYHRLKTAKRSNSGSSEITSQLMIFNTMAAFQKAI